MFRFSIRELMLVMVIAGTGLSCFLFRYRECEARKESELLKANMEFWSTGYWLQAGVSTRTTPR